MNIDANFIFLIVNSISTLMCGGVILYFIYIKKLERHLFYYLFGIGFLIYGTQFWGRILFSSLSTINIVSWIFSYFLFSVGLWCLCKRKSLLMVIIICFTVPFFLLIPYSINMITYNTCQKLGALLACAPVISLLIYQRTLFGKIADKFVIGWFLLLLANFILFGAGWIADIFAVFSKFILLLGIMDYDFIILTQRIREEIFSRPLPTETGYQEEGGLNLVIPSSSYPPSEKIAWIERLVLEGIKKGVSTHVFSFQDLISHRDLRKIKWINPEGVFVFLFSASAEKAKKEFTVLPMGITEIGATLSEIVKKALKEEEACIVIITNLSLLIHSFGVHSVYNMFLSKMGSLREGQVDVLAFFYPETHSDKSVVHLFTNIADKVIKL